MTDLHQTIIVDSNMSTEDILAQNPQNQAPQDVVDAIKIIPIIYYGFDDALHSGQIAMHKKLVQDMKAFFETALEIKFPIEKVIPISSPKYKWNDEVSCNDNNSSGYNYRLVGGTNRMSKHAEGLGFDINPVQNIFVKYDKDMKEIVRYPKDGVYDEAVKGTLTKNDPLVTLMKKLGWEWGGDWTIESGRIDYQHFEKKITN